MAIAEAHETLIGQSVPRKEDAAFLRGRGTYIDNLTLPGTLYMAIVRSPYAHARVANVNLDAARATEGVVAAFSGADLEKDWAGPLPMAWPVTEDTKNPPHYPLTPDEARYQGDGVAVVVAESRALAKDAAELVEVDYEQLDAVADVEKALADGAPLVHSDLGTNECYVWKLDVYAEEMLAAALALKLGRPVKWIEERAENYVATIHGRDVVHELTFAATKDGQITAVKSEARCAMGAYLQLVTPGIPLLGAWLYSGPYAIPNYSVTFTGVFTNTTPTDAYRGAGRPEATYVLERTMEALAAELGMDPIELRRKNFVTEFPYTLASGLTIDSGDYHASLDRLLELLDLDSIRQKQAEQGRGGPKLLGGGFSTYSEMCGLAPSRILGAIRYAVGGWDSATIRVQPLGSV